MRTALIIASALLVTACDARETGDAAMAPEQDEVTEATEADLTSVDMPDTPEGYAQQAAHADMYEIEAAKIAIDKASAADTREFARMMVEDHTASTESLKAAVARSDAAITLPTMLDSDRQAMLERLEALDGEQFDREYMTQQMAAHSKALALHQTWAQRSDDAALAAHAREVAPVIERHLDRLEGDMAGSAERGEMAPEG